MKTIVNPKVHFLKDDAVTVKLTRPEALDLLTFLENLATHPTSVGARLRDQLATELEG